MKRHRSRKIALVLVLLPLLVASLGMMWGNARMLDGISSSVNKLDETHNWQAIQSAFNNEVDRISGLISDNAKWDDAVTFTYEKFDEAWLLDTWGTSTSDSNYDTSFIVDRKGKALIGYQNGKRVESQPAEVYGKTYAELLSTLPGDATTFAIKSSLITSKMGVASIAIAPILPYSPDKKIPVKEPLYLVFSKTIDDTALQTMGEQYVIRGLKYVDHAKTSGTRFELKDNWGEPVAAVAWTSNNLGLLARESYFMSSIVAVGLLLLAMAPIAIGLGRTLLKLERNEQNERRMARTDALSGLPNRLHFMELVQEHLDQKTIDDCTVMLIDLDGFKMVNDIFDHATGDKLIRAVAAGLRFLVDQQCTVARLGGDEFAIAVFGADTQSRAVAAAENVLKFTSEPFNLDGRFAAIGASIGITHANDVDLEAQELMRRADIAMYKVKENGGNGHLNYELKLDLRNCQDSSIADELRGLLAKNDFDVNYQPLVEAGTGKIIGLETLARWPQSSSSKYSPDRFISVAEQYGMIDDLSMLLMKKAFMDVARWPNLKLSINISPVQLNNRNLVSDIETVAREAEFSLSRLEIEFTEAVMIKNSKRARDVIRELKRHGVSVALDDFGSGYASVGYLRKFNFDTIKLDRTLTRLASSNADALLVVQGAILIARGLSATVVAEGVETEEEARIMRLAGCHILQGYYFSRPQPASAITTLINAPLVQQQLLTA